MKKTYFGLVAALTLAANVANTQEQISAETAMSSPQSEPIGYVNEAGVGENTYSDAAQLTDQETAFDQEDYQLSQSQIVSAATPQDPVEPVIRDNNILTMLPDEIQSDGGFQYSVKIDIPSYRGLEPNLALVYNSSQKRYGDEGSIVGVGWSLAGTSMIERVSVGGGIASFVSGEDIYEIDGQPLLACADAWATFPYDPASVAGSATYPTRFNSTNSSASCAHGGQFVTLMDDGRRVKIIPDSDGGVSFPKFIVTMQSGTQYVYESVGKLKGLAGRTGYTADLDNYGYRTRFVLTEIRDTQVVANTVIFTYDFGTDSTAGSQSIFDLTDRLVSINYADYQVSFHYIDQDVPLRTSGLGHRNLSYKQVGLLTSVEVLDGSSKIRAYRFEHAVSAYLQMHHLASVTEFGSDYSVSEGVVVSGVSLPATEFEYSDDAVAFERVNYSMVEQTEHPLVVDLDEDGRSEIVFQREAPYGGSSFRPVPAQRNIYGFNSERVMSVIEDAITLPAPYYTTSPNDSTRYHLEEITSLNGPVSERGLDVFSSSLNNTMSRDDRYHSYVYGPSGASVGQVMVLGNRHWERLEAHGYMNLDRDPESELLARLQDGMNSSGLPYEFNHAGVEAMDLDVVLSSLDFDHEGVVGDFDGNGLSDIIFENEMYLAFEVGFRRYVIPSEIVNRPPDAYLFGSQVRIHVGDMNGDGLDDILRIYVRSNDSGIVDVYYSRGNGFEERQRVLHTPSSSQDLMPAGLPNIEFSRSEILRDVNADGFPDLILKDHDSDAFVLLWNGHKFRVATSADGTLRRFDRIHAVDDFDGDGLLDMFTGWSTDRVRWNVGVVPHLLTSIRTPLGANVSVEYAPSSDGDGDDPVVSGDRIPGIRQVVASVTVSDDYWVAPQTTRYRYRDGRYDYVWERSLGFGRVDTILPPAAGDDGEVVIKTYYNNDDFRTAGTQRLVRRVTRNAPCDDTQANPGLGCASWETLWQETTNEWRPVGSVPVHNPGDGFASRAAYVSNHETGGHELASGGPYRAKLLGSYTKTLHGDEYVETGVAYLPDQYGRRIQETDLGMTIDGVDPSEDGNISTRTQYVDNVELYILNTVRSELTYHGNALPNYTYNPDTWLTRNLYRYDSLADRAPPTSGNLTSVRRYERNSSSNGYGYPVAETRTYDGFGNVLTVTDARGGTTTYEYDTVKYLFQTAEVNALGHRTETAWDTGCQQPTVITDANELQTTRLYDTHCRLIEEQDPAQGVRLISYFLPQGKYQNIETRTLSGSTVASDVYHHENQYIDGLGRTHMVAQSSDEGDLGTSRRYTKLVFDTRGRQVSVSIPLTIDEYHSSVGNLDFNTRVEYDALDRSVRRLYPDGTKDETIYTTLELPLSAGQVGASSSLTAPHPQTVFRDAHCFDAGSSNTLCSPLHVTADHRGNRIRSTLSDPGSDVGASAGDRVTEYMFDALNRLVGVKDPIGATWTYTYDTIGRRLTSDDPGLGYWTMEYDANGNLIRQTDAKGQVITFTYDWLNRVVSKHAGPELVVYAYDEPRVGAYNIGRLTTVENAVHRVEHDYNAIGLPIRQHHWVDDLSALDPHFTFDTGYRAGGHVESLSIPLTVGGVQQQLGPYRYNRASQMIGFDNYVTDVLYDKWGNPTRMDLGNGVSDIRDYSPNRGWLNSIRYAGTHGTDITAPSVYLRSATGRVREHQATL
ncbi:toxin TcdB middle/N-terminal domain-containing protein, partial [Cognatiyoonia sp. IB215182]|uniref:toxin TcdB middle/N-terminal domain-containing protein n=1 Tax=Cognatiyoonia sp. IB215182 TaxID=3097353 RepID=UPI002A100772